MKRFRTSWILTFLFGVLASSVVLSTPIGVGALAATAYEELDLFTSVLSLIRKSYVESIDDRTLVRGAIRGMLSELDPHSSYLDPEEFREMQIDTRGEFAGIGIEIVKGELGFIEVIAPIEGTPAFRAGIQAKDQIAEICPTLRPEGWNADCRSTKEMSLDEAVRYMRGRKGTKLTLQILRADWKMPHPYVIVRDIVKVESVSGKLLEPGYAYLRIRQFQERTDKDLRNILEALRRGAQRGAAVELRGLVLDLRDNPGGLLEQAVAVADLWLDSGVIVQTRGRLESQTQIFSARPEATEPHYPLVVLVNEGSASASEIVAGALQDQHRALILGTPTFGKGSVQTIYPLGDGSGLRLTTALYYTPSDRSIQEVGIAPDILVVLSETAPNSDGAAPDAVAATPDASQREKLREKDLERHFSNQDPGANAASPQGAGSSIEGDAQLARALEVLKSWTYFERLKLQSQATAQ